MILNILFLLYTASIANVTARPLALPDSRDLGHHLPASLVFERGQDIWFRNADGKEQVLIKNAKHPSWSPDGSILAFIRHSAIWIMPFSKPDKVKKVCDLPGVGGDEVELPTIAWHPGGKWINYSSFAKYEIRNLTSQTSGISQNLLLGSLWRIRADLKRQPILWLTPWVRGWESVGIAGVSYPCWSPDGKTLAYVRGGNIWAIEVSKNGLQDDIADMEYSGYAIKQILVSGGSSHGDDIMGAGALAWSSDGKRIVYEVKRLNGAAAHWINELDIKTKKVRTIVLVGGQPQYTPDGRAILYTEQAGLKTNICLFDLSTRKSRCIVRDASYPICQPQRK